MNDPIMVSPVRHPSSALGWILGSLGLYAVSPSVTIFLARRGLNATEMFFFYSLGSVIFLSAINPFMGRTGRKRMDRRSLAIAVLLGIFGYTLYYCLYLVAMTRTSAAGVPMVMMANYLWPLFTFILMALWVEHRTVRMLEWGGLVVSAVGVYFSRSSGFTFDRLSNLQWPLLALAGAFVWGGFSAATQKWKVQGVGSILIYNLVALVVSGVWLAISGFGHFWVTSLIAIVAGMLFNSLAACLYFAGLERQPTAGQLALFNLSPLAALTVMALWQKVPMGWPVWVGAVLIITGIMLARMGRQVVVRKPALR